MRQRPLAWLEPFVKRICPKRLRKRLCLANETPSLKTRKAPFPGLSPIAGARYNPLPATVLRITDLRLLDVTRR